MTAMPQRAWAKGGAAVLLATLALGTGASVAHAADDDPDAQSTPGGAMVIAVVIPDRVGGPAPASTPVQTPQVAGGGRLPATGADLQQLLPWVLGGLAAAGAGAALATRRRRA